MRPRQHPVTGIEPFQVHASSQELAGLRARLRATRWPDAPEDAGWSLGVDVGYLRELVAYWAEEFDWPAYEDALARLPRFRARIAELGVAFLHVRAAAPAGPVLPLVLCHGWPDSSWRYEKVVPLLTDPGAYGADPADAFDVVVPDMPGFGHSDRPAGPPLDSIAVAAMWAELMTGLGYPRFGAAGGDIGGGVSRYLALDHAERVVAVHRMEAGVPVAGFPDLTPEERAYIDAVAAWRAGEGAYADMHRTKPQTAAVGLTDSPAGLAAWIVEKLRSWSDCHGDVENSFTRDEICGLLTRYWLTGTIGSSMRMYAANAAIPPGQHTRRVEVPSGFALFPGDILRPPRAWLERTANVVRLTGMDRGGHFAPFEEPELYARELREFFRPYRAAVAPS
ncbi:epoxide hydrolase [Couchioplanes caeruleus]|uniref:epoxide hydrolase family protein n=1 Tax=Couchioplanes caeruleus TaxID=56438 RepID=UPI0020C02FA2|nr:epoxide hydrolase family protein [Couchioplanes caeruleus]UQU61634.1 epoxide hydrolase [Couchioplanes caeruleus]